MAHATPDGVGGAAKRMMPMQIIRQPLRG